MIGKFLKKIFGNSDSKNKDEGSFALKLRDKSAKFLTFASEKFESAQAEIISIREKFKDLRETNYNLGMKHLENGNIFDAILRFRIIKKAWPDFFDAYYQLAYCLTLKNQTIEAKEVIQELLDKNPNYDPKAHELLSHIEASMQNELVDE
jgi:tetratricopeptide (TPR) repeat protein